MRTSMLLLGAAAGLGACGQSGGNEAAGQVVANSAQPAKKPAYCFFKDRELKGWTAKRDKDGNIAVKGKAHVSDPRYKAIIGTPEVTGTAAAIVPTIGQNDTGYGAQGDTWDLAATIPNSTAVTSVTVACGDKTVAALKVPGKG